MEQYGSRLDIIKEYGYFFRMRQIKEREMKKLLALVLVIMMLFMTACGKKEEGKDENPAPGEEEKSSAPSQDGTQSPADIEGIWKESAPEYDDEYIAAIVRDGQIDIYKAYIDDYYSIGGYYEFMWGGDLTGTADGFSSKKDDLRAVEEDMRMDEDEIAVSYKDGKLQVKIELYSDKPVTLELIPGEPDELLKAMGNYFEVGHIEKKELIVTGEYNVLKDYTSLHFCYSVKIENPNELLSLIALNLEITGKVNGEEQILVTNMIPNIAAGDTAVVASVASLESEDVTDVEFKVKTIGYASYVLQSEYDLPKYDALKVSNVKQEGSSMEFTLDVTNGRKEDIPFVLICAVYRNKGELVATDFDYEYETIAAGETKSFDFDSVYKKFEFDEVEFYAYT